MSLKDVLNYGEFMCLSYVFLKLFANIEFLTLLGRSFEKFTPFKVKKMISWSYPYHYLQQKVTKN